MEDDTHVPSPAAVVPVGQTHPDDVEVLPSGHGAHTPESEWNPDEHVMHDIDDCVVPLRNVSDGMLFEPQEHTPWLSTPPHGKQERPSSETAVPFAHAIHVIDTPS